MFEKKKIAMCFGTFDRLHPGHISFISQAKKYGDTLIVVVARDRNVEKIKGKKPHDSEIKRLKKIKGLHIADQVVLGGKKDKLDIIRKIKPQVICLGYDQIANLQELKDNFAVKIIRLKAFKPDVYKTSLMGKKSA